MGSLVVFHSFRIAVRSSLCVVVCINNLKCSHDQTESLIQVSRVRVISTFALFLLGFRFLEKVLLSF